MGQNRIIIRPEAEAELNEAFIWYEEKVRGLGFDFIIQVDACLNSIERTPEIYPLVHRNIRRTILRKFPYEVFYVIGNQTISVLAVFHAKRNPTHWENRT